eukprot:g82443.t1
MMSRTFGTLFKIVLVFAATSPFLFSELCGSNITSRTAGVAVTMAVMWTLELVPLAVTALLPVISFPLLGIMSGKEVSALYMNDILMVVFGSSLFGCAIEAYNLHKFIALTILSKIGVRAKPLLLAFMCVAALISMWLSNTATAVLLMPMATATTSMLDGKDDSSEERKEVEHKDSTSERTSGVSPFHVATSNASHESPPNRSSSSSFSVTTEGTVGGSSDMVAYHNFRKALVISIGYATTLGGMSTTIGTGTNLTFVGIYTSLFPEAPPITFATWILYGFPLSVILVLGTWALLVLRFIGFSSNDPFRHVQQADTIFVEQINKLGPLDRNQKVVMCIFLLLILTWFTRDFGFAPGWSSWFKEPGFITDGTVCVGLAFLFFILPHQPPTRAKAGLSSKRRGVRRYENKDAYQSLSDANEDTSSSASSAMETEESPSDLLESESSLLSLPAAAGELQAQPPGEQPKTMLGKQALQSAPWGTLLLLGGAFALAAGFESSGLTECVAQSLEFLDMLPWVFVLVFICVTASMISELNSNVATNTIMQPIVKAIALQIEINPLALMIPVTLACSCSTMLPISTPPNSISYQTGYYTTRDMLKAGVWVKIFGLTTIIFTFLTFGVKVFGINLGGPMPSWALAD